MLRNECCFQPTIESRTTLERCVKQCLGAVRSDLRYGARWLLEHLLQAEGIDRAMRSVSHNMQVAKFPVHRDIASFDFEISVVDRKRANTLVTTDYTDDAHNVSNP